jgi:hypothetical protein
MFGVRHKADHSTGYATTDDGTALKAGGLRYFISTYVKNLAGATLNEAYFKSIFKDIFRYGSERKVLVCSSVVKDRIIGYGLSQIQYKSDEKTYGWDVTTWNTGHGLLDIMPHKLLDDINTVTNTPFDGDLMFWVDFNEIKRINKQTLTLYKDVQTKQQPNLVWDFYQAKYSWKFGREYCHGIIYGGK